MKTMIDKPPHMNPSSLKSRFTTRFLRALAKIHAQKPISSSSPTEMFRRCRRIKIAADKSMAYSVRSRRIWSRAVIWKLRRRCTSSGGRGSVKTVKSRQAIMKRTRHEEKQNKNTRTTTGDQEDHGAVVGFEADELREVVPGGEAMDLCNLLDETAHYIKCLNTQVQVMKQIADHFYSSK